MTEDRATPGATEPAGGAAMGAAAKAEHTRELAATFEATGTRAAFERGLYNREQLTPEEKALLRKHVVNLNQGVLSGGGLFDNTEADVRAIFEEHLPAYLAEVNEPVRVVFYAHGGLVDEASALRTALRHIQWWNENGKVPGRRVYPIYFVWETGLFETLGQMLSRIGRRSRERGVRDVFDYTSDPLIEAAARVLQGGRIWGAMKSSALAASSARGGAYFAAQRLQELLGAAGDRLELHAVGHSAGSIFHTYFVPTAFEVAGKPFASGYFMAPAVRCDTFQSELLGSIGGGRALERLVMFTMHKDAERADHCANIYRKSLLYLIFHALEQDPRTPLLGLEESLRSDPALRALFGLSGAGGHGEVIWSPTPHTGDASSSRSRTHGGFDDDAATMESILRRVCGVPNGAPITPYPAAGARSLDPWTSTGQVDPDLAFLLEDGAAAPSGRVTSAWTMGTRTAPASALAGSALRAGRRRALCVGINDYPRAPLGGCVQDARDWAGTLEGLGFEPARMLLDDTATRAAILHELDLLIQTSKPGDVVVFQFAGHGTQADDTSGDEAGGDTPGQDEAICPYDFDQGHLLLDDDLGRVLESAPDGVCVTCFIDCCHSGTITRFAAGQPPGARVDERPRYLKLTPAEQAAHVAFRRTQRRAPVRRRSLDEMTVVVFSACLSHEVALESDGHGHFTLRATAELARATLITNEEFSQRVIEAFPHPRRQHPNLDCAPQARSAPLFSGGRIPAVSTLVPPSGGASPLSQTAVGPNGAGDRKIVAQALRAAAEALER